MSRVGQKPIEIPKGVKLAVSAGTVNVDGPKGKMSFPLSHRIKANLKDDKLTLERATDSIADKAIHGTTRSCIASMVKGVTDGFMKELQIEGVGFKAALQGKQLNLSLGFTHPCIFDIPEGITAECPKPTIVIIKGADKVKVGHFAAAIRKMYEAEPYKGKGVRYAGEQVRRKAGKTVTK
jgi:large subunit ribosomal protein L6